MALVRTTSHELIDFLTRAGRPLRLLVNRAPRRWWRPRDPSYKAAKQLILNVSYDVAHNHAFDARAISQAGALSVPVVHTLHLPPENQVATALQQVARQSVRPIVATVSDYQAVAGRAVTPVSTRS